jgi:hypothetical protein
MCVILLFCWLVREAIRTLPGILNGIARMRREDTLRSVATRVDDPDRVAIVRALNSTQEPERPIGEGDTPVSG